MHGRRFHRSLEKQRQSTHCLTVWVGWIWHKIATVGRRIATTSKGSRGAISLEPSGRSTLYLGTSKNEVKIKGIVVKILAP